MAGPTIRRSVVALFTVALLAPLLSGCLFFSKKATVTRQQRPGEIEGVVRYLETGQAAAGVSVTLFGSQMVAVTDSQGRFSFPSASPGWRTVLARKNGYVLGARTVRVDSGQAENIVIPLQLSEGHLHGMSARVQPDLCGSCHKLHQEPMLRGGNANYACLSGCHDKNPRYSRRAIYEQTLHSAKVPPDDNSPVALSLPGKNRGDCINCHEPHGVNNDHPHLLPLAAPENSNPVCFACHVNGGSGHTLDWPGRAAYEQTGNPHFDSSSTAKALANYPESEATKGECYNCHNPHGQETGLNTGVVTAAMTRADREKLCVGCHFPFAPKVKDGTKHECSMCHNPHQVRQSGFLVIKEPGKTGVRSLKQVVKKAHRDAGQVITDDYCKGCHNSNQGNPYLGRAKDPLAGGTKFTNLKNTREAKYVDLHRVHILGPIGVNGGKIVNTWPGGGSGSGSGGGSSSGSASNTGVLRRCYPGGYGHDTVVPDKTANAVWCVDCHDPHSSVGADGQVRHHLLRADRVLIADNSGGTGYNGKGACSMANSDCHAGYAKKNDGSNDTSQNGCNWCHRVGSNASPGQSCDCMNPCSVANGATYTREYEMMLKYSGDYPSYWSGSGSKKSPQFLGHGHTHTDMQGITSRPTVEL